MIKRTLLAITASLTLAACGDYPSGPEGSVWVGKGDGQAFGGIMTLVNGETQELHVNCPFGQLCGVDINNWWLSGIEMPQEDEAARYGIGVEVRTSTAAPAAPEESSRFAGLGDVGTFTVFRGAATLSFEPQGWLPPKGIEVELKFPSCGAVTWCPSFRRAFR